MTEPEQWAVELWEQAYKAVFTGSSPENQRDFHYPAVEAIQRALEERERIAAEEAHERSALALTPHELAKAIADQTVPEDCNGYTLEKWFIARDAVLAALATRQDAPVTENSHDH